MTLKGMSALVTGSVQGIGLEIAKSLAEQGAAIALHGLADQNQIQSATDELMTSGASEVLYFSADLIDPIAIENMMKEAQAWGGIDILVNNAGIQQTVSMSDATRDVWDRILAVNLSACFDTMRLALPIMAERGYGRVVNIASVHGLVASQNKAPYVAAKHGLIGLTKVAALEYAKIGSAQSGGVTVNAICPGWTETAIIEPQIIARGKELGVDRTGAIASLLSEKQPSQRTSHPSEIGGIVTFLCQKGAHNITGSSIPVDGGWTAQ